MVWFQTDKNFSTYKEHLYKLETDFSMLIWSQLNKNPQSIRYCIVLNYHRGLLYIWLLDLLQLEQGSS